MTLDTAWVVRACVLRELEKRLSDIPWVETWQEMYDPCIFKDNGLRMVGSRKAIPCPTCKGASFRHGTKGTWGEVRTRAGWGDIKSYIYIKDMPRVSKHWED